MKKAILMFSVVLLLMSCGAKRSRTLLQSGNYDAAISKSVNALRGKKDKESKQDFVLILEEAFAKAADRDIREINILLADANQANLDKVLRTYQALHNRQELIRPLLPLKIQAENRNAMFVFEDYSEQIADSKNALAKFLYTNARNLLESNSKSSIRKAYDDLIYLEKLSPAYRDTRKLIEDAKFRGTDYVAVSLQNVTQVIIPKRLEEDLLDFSTYGLDTKWLTYHNSPQNNIDYSYEIMINFTDIDISPEQVKEKQIVSEKQVKVGTKKLLDGRGRVVNDSLGKPVMVDDMKTVKATITEFRQFKATRVAAQVDYIDLNSNKIIKSFPVASEFIFENVYATFRGDKRAIDKNYNVPIENRAIPFPTNEEMVFDTGKDLKAKIKAIVTGNRISK
jgi:hypothetical protein